MQIIVRPATLEDSDACAKLFDIGEDEFKLAPEFFRERAREFHDKALGEESILVAESDGEVVGMITRQKMGKRNLVGSLVVHPESRGQGIAHVLLDVASDGKGLALLWNGSKAQHRVFESVGYRPVGVLMEKG